MASWCLANLGTGNSFVSAVSVGCHTAEGASGAKVSKISESWKSLETNPEKIALIIEAAATCAHSFFQGIIPRRFGQYAELYTYIYIYYIDIHRPLYTAGLQWTKHTHRYIMIYVHTHTPTHTHPHTHTHIYIYMYAYICIYTQLVRGILPLVLTFEVSEE